MSEQLLQQEKDEYWMMQALRLAQAACAQGEVPVAAVLIKDDIQIAQSYNQSIALSDPTAHAEMLCLRAAAATEKNYRLTDTTLYVTLEPCAMCAGALIHARVKRLVYAAREPKAGCVHSNVQLLNQNCMNHVVQVTAGILAAEAAKIVTDFFAVKRQAKRTFKKTVSIAAAEESISSPCVSVCALNSDDICMGCYRSCAEITAWNSLSNEDKKHVVMLANQRCNDMWS